MSRRRASKPWLRLGANSSRRERVRQALRDPETTGTGPYSVVDEWHDSSQGLPSQQIDMPDDEKVLLKTVPAKIAGKTVGEAMLFDDGSVDFRIDDLDALTDEERQMFEETKEEFRAFMNRE